MEGQGADGDEREAEKGSKLFSSFCSAIRCGTNDRGIRESLQSLSRSKLLSEKIVSVQETLDGETLRVLFSPVYDLLLEEAESSVKSSKSTLLKWQLDAMLNLQRLFGKDHLILSDFFMDVASRLSESKRFGEALDYGGRALLMRINVLGLAHSKTAESHFCLGRLYHSLKSYEESRREFYICRGVYEKLSDGESTLELAECDYAIGEMEVDALNFGAAFHLFYSCYCTRLSILGAWNELTIKAKEMVEDYRQVNGERHISSLEMRDRIEELRWKLEEANSAEYTISVFIGSIKDTANYSLTLTQLKTLVKTAVKYSISRGSGSVSPMNSPFKSPLESPSAGTKDHKSYRQHAEKLLGLLLNSNEDWGEWTVGSATSDTNSEFTEEEKGDVGLHGNNNDDDYQFASDSDLPTVADCLENDNQSEGKGGMDDSDRVPISKETKSGLVEEDKVEYSGGEIDSERVGSELALSRLLTEVTTDSSSYSIKDTNGSDSSDLKNKSSTTVISRKISKGISKAAPRKSSSGKARISVLSEITKVTSSRSSDSIEVTEDKGSSDGSEVLTFSMAGRTSLVCRDRSGVMVEVRVLENLAYTNDLPSTLNFSPNAKNELSASSAKNESRASSAEHKSSQDLVTIPQPPPLPNSWPPVCLNLSLEDFLQSSHPENQSIDRHADGGKVTLKNQNAPTIKSWEPIENVEGTLWVKSSDVIVPWGDLFSDFESVFNREPERVVPHKSAAVAKKKPSILLASKDVVETKIPMPRQKQIELMLNRIGRDINISDLATAVKQLDTAIIDTSRQSLIQENLPTSEEVALITQLADKAKKLILDTSKANLASLSSLFTSFHKSQMLPLEFDIFMSIIDCRKNL